MYDSSQSNNDLFVTCSEQPNTKCDSECLTCTGKSTASCREHQLLSANRIIECTCMWPESSFERTIQLHKTAWTLFCSLMFQNSLICVKCGDNLHFTDFFLLVGLIYIKTPQTLCPSHTTSSVCSNMFIVARYVKTSNHNKPAWH